ncbi:uncharacterized protein ATNIH1004_011834 [Aspergillus tanneri]|uniref:Uncharacterized protein n=1 Tax=Aspergillus tanneri TaxID=1220188 RepID=A0A5M9M4K5_9EURO|nr:uncharacterized protein ATNIH1004_011834 [Aspergillus tanneri]KAA8641698.1 hypothetical protein ATNIH1004_011834 [Aspergillus tanneri]
MPRKISTVERVVKARNRRQAKTGPEKELQKRHDADRKAKFDCLKKLKETGIWKSAPESLKQQLEDNALAQLWQERFDAKRSKEWYEKQLQLQEAQKEAVIATKKNMKQLARFWLRSPLSQLL